VLLNTDNVEVMASEDIKLALAGNAESEDAE